MNDMYRLIEELCRRRNINITQLCKETGIPRSVLSELKSGRTKKLSNKYLPLVADYFSVSTDYFLTGEEKNEKPTTTNDDELYELLEEIRRNPDLRTMFSITKGSTPEQMRQYMKIIKAIRGED